MSETNSRKTPTANGVQIDMLNGTRLKNVGTAEKIGMILDSVRDGNIVILGEGLSPDEEGQLIEKTMTQIQPDGFSGIDIETYKPEEKEESGFLGRVFNKEEDESKLTVIGPANKIETLHKDETLLSTLVTND